MLKRGDTLIEVMFSVGIFGAIAIGAIALMNDGLNTSQNTLETTMARQEIDAQIEALRFIHSAYASESKRDDSVYRPIWQSLTANAYEATAETGGILLEDNEFYTRIVENDKSCDEIYSNGFPAKSFVINPRKLDSSTVGTDTVVYYDNPGTSAIRPASVYPRLLYGATTDESALSDATIENGDVAVHNNSTLTAAEGIWVTAIRSGTSIKDESGIERPDFYDFYINYSMPCGTLAMTITSELDSLATLMREINTRYTWDNQQTSSLQYLDGYSPHLFYDYGDYVSHLCTDSLLLTRFNEQLQRAVPLASCKYTPTFYSAYTNRQKSIQSFSGLTISDPSTHHLATPKNQTNWYKATH